MQIYDENAFKMVFSNFRYMLYMLSNLNEIFREHSCLKDVHIPYK